MRQPAENSYDEQLQGMLDGFAQASPRQRSAKVLAAANALGFSAAGVCDAGATDHAQTVRAWIADGKHGSMHYLAERLDAMLHPDGVLPGARSILCVADRYAAPRDRRVSEGPAVGWIARYARGGDYHRVLRRRLTALVEAIGRAAPEHETRAAVDTAPLLEREYAERAGIGRVGKNTLVIRRGEGSWFVLGEVLTTLELEPSQNDKTKHDPCGTCTRCIDACPTQAITPFAVDGSRCLSYTTIEHRGPIDPALFAPTGDWLFGCDICQEVCPHNQPTNRKRELQVLEAYEPRRTGFDLLEVLSWTEADRREAFVTSAMKRAKLEMFKRNALICAGNALRKRALPELRQRVIAIAHDHNEEQLVRETAQVVLRQLEIE